MSNDNNNFNGSSGNLHSQLRQACEDFRKGINVPLERVSRWMKADDREAQGVAYELLTRKPIDYLDIADQSLAFRLNYLHDCIKEDASGTYRLNRFESLMEIREWIVQIVNRERDKRELVHLEDLLASICLKLTAAQEPVVHTVLEHVFMHKQVRRTFHSWNSSDQLSVTYKESIALSDKWISLRDKRCQEGSE